MEFYQVTVERKEKGSWVPAYPLALFETEEDAAEYALWKELKFVQNHRCVIAKVLIISSPVITLQRVSF
jgi:hypothetical protein